MPPLVANGPDLPVEVLQAHEEGRLVLFCGAGVSLAAGLPTFRGLVDRVYEHLGSPKEPGEESAYRSNNFDRVLELLERRMQPEFVRPAVAAALRTASEATLETHQNLLELARHGDRLRLVTTNFDNLFECAAEGLDDPPRIHVAPYLPVPRPDLSGIVHLHGALPFPEATQEASGSEALRDLILTSSDFGRAYLTEGWASRFLRDLFRELSVLFIGYSVTDPVVRYLTDALSTQRRRGQAYGSAWLFAGSKKGRSGKRERLRWSELGVELIPYHSRHKHVLVERTLKEWAHLYRGGLQTRANWALSKRRRPPSAAVEDEARMVVWALCEPSGAVAAKWADEASPKPHSAPSADAVRIAMRWLELFEESDKLGGASLRLLGSLQPAAASTQHIAGGARDWFELPPPAFHMARWLCWFLGCDDLLHWIVSKGCALHPQFACLLREELARRPDIDGWKRRFLEVISAPSYQTAIRYGTGWQSWREGFDTPTGRLELARALRPIPRFHASPGSSVGLETGSQDERGIGATIDLAGHRTDVYGILQRLEAAETESALPLLAHTLTQLLEEGAGWLTFMEPDQGQSR